MNTVYQFIPVLIVGFAASLGLTPVSRQIAMRLGVIDQPNAPRKQHKESKPMMGGLAIYVALSLSVLVFAPAQHLRELGIIITGAGILAFIGALDDRYDLSWRTRLLVQFIAAAMLIFAGIQIRLTGWWLVDISMTLIWIVALTNSTNFLDNMDGLTAGLSAIAAAGFLLIAFTEGQVLVALLAAAILGSAIGFLAHNFAPSNTFMGDMGALVLGYLLATLGIKLNFGAQPLSVTWMIPILVLALPIFDINLVVFTRLREGRSPADAGRDHTSHRLLAIGFSARQTLFVLYSVCILFALLAFVVSVVEPWLGMIVGISGLSFLALSALVMMWIRERYQLSSNETTQNATSD